MTTLIIITIGAALLLGFFAALLLQNKNRKQCATLEVQLQEREKTLAHSLSEQQQQQKIISEQTSRIATLQATNVHLQEKLGQQVAEIETLQKRLTSEFENIANKILKERAAELSITNEQKLGAIVNPLGEKIADFRKQVTEAYNLEARDKAGLQEAIKNLAIINSQMQQEASNLTKALKGDVKKQGNWGEIQLERVLEVSGLVKGREYVREEVIEGVEGTVQRPDVIIHLPDNKHIIIDSKVSLRAYERMMQASDETIYNQHLKEHLTALKNQIKGLAERNYQLAQEMNTPDFVLLFLPIEASFAVSVQADPELFTFAWDRKIVIVSPTTLLATLRTIASIWKQENQTKNAMEIAQLSGRLYDKLVGFLSDWNKVKEHIDRAGRFYDDAMSKMSEGQGNLFRTADKIKLLGAKTAKELPQD
ncbi:MAG: DNA recombination protein RmuC [Prevotellaceae bacterium]|jgi:DNA recombination protein RmuC|nr:DNA recombination protein RmuC [Prevotellaceae bacterium]